MFHVSNVFPLSSRRSNDREAARRSWGPADKEEGNREFWASIQEPYDYIMGSNLIPDSCQVREKKNFLWEKSCSVFLESVKVVGVIR